MKARPAVVCTNSTFEKRTVSKLPTWYNSFTFPLISEIGEVYTCAFAARDICAIWNGTGPSVAQKEEANDQCLLLLLP